MFQSSTITTFNDLNSPTYEILLHGIRTNLKDIALARSCVWKLIEDLITIRLRKFELYLSR